MMSKAIKSTPKSKAYWDREKERKGLAKILFQVKDFFLMEVYYRVQTLYRRYTERIGRSLAFAKHGWMHYDFESAYLYDIMAFKLKRIHATLLTGHAVQYPKDMNALKEAIKICERLFKGDHEWVYHRKHDKKWGKIRTKTTPIYTDDGKIKHYTWTSSRGKAKTKKQKELERKEFLQCWTLGEIDRKADLDRLNEILKTHEPSWWD